MLNLFHRSLRLSCTLLILFIAGLLGCKTQSASVEQNPPPQAQPNLNNEFKSPDMDTAKWMDRFEREGREIYDKRADILKAVNLKPGDSVADVGAGSGLFTLMFAEAVGPQGKVYAVDISDKFLGLINERATQAGLKNVTTVLGTAQSSRLPKNSVGAVFICDTYHHFENPQSTMTSIHQALKKDGQLIIIDFKKIPGQSREWIMNHVRATQEETTREIEAAGFKQVDELDILEENYVLRFRKVSR